MSNAVSTTAVPPSLTFRAMLLLIPVFFTLHNLEEAGGVETLTDGRLQHIMYVTADQTLVAIILGTLLGWALAVACWSAPRGSKRLHVLLGLQAILALNILTHVGGTIMTASYIPGVLTALLLELPLTVFLFRRARREEILSRRAMAITFLAALLAYGPTVWLLLAFGRWATWNI
ncbi:MAG TPA: HXXEE domain-containing protein [bacterium]|nr:HXXEE domain-containing protein [bacterium]